MNLDQFVRGTIPPVPTNDRLANIEYILQRLLNITYEGIRRGSGHPTYEEIAYRQYYERELIPRPMSYKV